MPGWRHGGSHRGCSVSEEWGAPHCSHPALVSSWEALLGEGASGMYGSSVKRRPAAQVWSDVPVLRWHYGDRESSRQEERRAPVNSSCFCQLKTKQKARAMPGGMKMPPSSFWRWMGRKTLVCPLPSPPGTLGQCSSLDCSSPLQQDSSCFDKLI